MDKGPIKAMRVLYVTANSYLRSTTSALNAVLRELRPEGLEPVMLFKEPGPWQRELAAEGIPCYFDSLSIPDKYQPLRSIRNVWRLVRLTWQEKIELIHCNEHEHYPLMRLVARCIRLPIIVTLHFKVSADFGRWAFRPPYLPSCLQFLSRAQHAYCRHALPQELGSDRIKLSMSGLAIDSFLAHGDRIRLRSDWGVNDQTVVVGTASTIRPHKKLEEFVQIIGSLRRRQANVLGVIAGGGRFADPAYSKRLRDLIQREQLNAHCLMVGELNPIAPFMKAIDIFVSTSEWETFGMSICEAMACGKPVLAYKVGGIPEIIPDAWCMAPCANLSALIEKVERLVADAEFRKSLGTSAERFVRANFDAPVLAARQAAIYKEVLGRQLGSPRTQSVPESALEHSK